MNYINDSIKIDFAVPELLQTLLDEAEEYDKAEALGDYVGTAGAIDVLCKGLVRTGKHSQSQWDLLCKRYPEI